MSAPRPAWLGSAWPLAWVGLAVVATAYFLTGIDRSLDWVDEGMIVTAAWRTGQGQMPYRDFVHIYGPALFALQGALLQWFGEDLRTLRLALVVVKLVLTLEVGWLSRRLAPEGVALLVTALIVAVLGMPGVLLTTPYAAFFTLLLVLLGVIVLADRPSPGAARLAVCGACFGLAATFKQTSGLFAFLALALFLVWRREQGTTREPTPGATPISLRLPRLAWMARTSLLALVVATALVLVQYTAAGWGSVTTALVAAAPGLAIAAAWYGRFTRGSAGSQDLATFGQVTAAGVGFAIPLTVVVVLYARAGALRALVFDTVQGLPQMVHWFVAFYRPPWRVVAMVVALAGLCAIALAARGTGRTVARRAALVLGAVAVGFALDRRRPGFPRDYLGEFVWHTDLMQTLFWIPIPLVLWALAGVLGSAGRVLAEVGVGDAAAEKRQWLRGLLGFQAAVGILALHPAADLFHVLLFLPLLAPVLADRLALASAVEGSPRWAARAVLAWVVAVTLSLAVVPRWTAPPVADPREAGGVPLGRATGIWTADPELPARSRLIADLAGSLAPGDPFLVITGLPLLHFLSGRPSVFEAEDMLLYLLRIGILEPAAVRALVDEPALVERLRTSGAPVVEDTSGPTAARFREALPEVGRLIDERYRESARYGTLRLLRPST